MRDEHLIYTSLADGKILIKPKTGYWIYCTLSRKTVSEAITIEKNLKYFVSVEAPEDWRGADEDIVTLDDTLDMLREFGVEV